MERICHQQIHTKGYTKGNSSETRKMIPDGILEMQEEMKHNKKIQYLGKYK